MAKVATYGLMRGACTLLILLLVTQLGAQGIYRLVIKSVEVDSAILTSKTALKTSFPNKAQATNYISNIPSLLQAKGFIAASVDSLIVSDSSATIHLYLGNQYLLGNIKVNEHNVLTLQQATGKKVNFNEHKINFAEYQLLQQKLLDYFENTGYPFAKIGLDSLSIANDTINGAMFIDRGIAYKFDSIRVFGPAKISKNFIHRYLNIEPGSPYNREKLETIDQRLIELPYLQQAQSWDVTMLSTGSLINLYLQPKKSNQVNILAGFLPSNQQTGGKLLFTVDANLQLQNVFGGGERLGLVWQQIQPKSPRLNLQFQQPYIFNSPFGVDFLFELYKKDSTFLNINAQAGLQYVLSANQTGKVLIQTFRSNVLLVDTIAVKSTKRLPDLADVTSTNLGFEFDFNKTNYRYNPRSGNEFTMYISAGSKNIRKNNSITEIKDAAFNYSSLYDSVKLKSYQVRLRLKAAHYFPLGKQSVLKAGFNSALFQSSNYFRNELYQIGGYRLLRGFDEESIFASKYAVGTLEYRYLLGLNSYFFGFSDLGWSKDDSRNVPSYKYFGTGLGLSFETKGGIFNISVAAGKRNDLNFNIRQGKIHLGYVSVF